MDTYSVQLLGIIKAKQIKNFFLIAGLYGLVNNAGICVCGEFEWLTWKQIQRQVEVNLLGTMRVTKYCMPLLKSGQGKIFELLKPFSYFRVLIL